jgi:hypothetical protein
LSITVIAHVCQGEPSPFPHSLTELGISVEGSFIPHPDGGGVIVVSYETPHSDLVRKAFEEHLIDHDLTAFAMHRRGESSFFYSKTQATII